MDAPKKKVTAKLTQPEQPASASSLTSPAPIRAKISGTARTRATSAVSAPPSQTLSNGALRPIASSVIARRSPSPSKMLLSNKALRAPLSKGAPQIGEHKRGGSVSMFFLSAQSSTSAPPTPIMRTNGDASLSSLPATNSNPPPQRVKAKVSGLARAKSASTASTSSASGISPSLSTIVSPPSPQTSPAKTLHKRTPSQYHINASTPQSVPLPTSPPASTTSFSSHSSTSTSSQSHTTSISTTPPFSMTHVRADSKIMSPLAEDANTSPPLPPPPQRELVARVRPGTRISGGRSSVSGSNPLSTTGSVSAADEDVNGPRDMDEDDEDDDRPAQSRTGEEQAFDEERAEAKSNRKIADLEITTRSLLAINASLEAAKVRQAREIRDLRRRLRETRLVLPPRTFRQLRDKDGPTHAESEDEEGSEEESDWDEDETFARMRALVEELLDTGRKAVGACASPLSAGLDGASGGDGVKAEGEMGRPEVLGWEGGGKHGVAIGSRVLSPEEAGWWAKERDRVGVEGREENATPVGVKRGEEDLEHPNSGDDGIS